jgi:eukaryotic-like serine/threonine-protein kinase
MGSIGKDLWEALRPLLDAALELEPDERAAWLERQRAERPDLIDHVETLLERESRVDHEGFLAPGSGPERPDAGASLAGRSLGPWLLERQLGQGGMGTVWLARRHDGRFEGEAAIKFLRLSLANPAGEARFRREGSFLARLTHPNIARLLDAGVSAGGQPYLVLEHVDGAPIDAWCDQKRLGVPGRIALFRQVLGAVAHAHANLIVHRDLKPSNILVADDATVKLLDFGIARLLDEDRDHLSGGTTGDRMLTFDYAAPEQIRGDPASVATDVYALGIVLYELLCGRHPTNAGCRTPAERMQAVLGTDPLPLSRAVTTNGEDEAVVRARARASAVDRLAKVCAGDLENVVARALEKEPARRYATVSAFEDDLERYLGHQPVSARRPTWGYRSGKFLRRNRGSVLTALLVFLALIGATTVTAVQAREARRQRDAALYQGRRAEAQIEFEQLLLSEIGDGPVSMRVLLDRGRDLLERHYAADPPFIASLLIDLSDRYGELGDRPARAEILNRADSIVRAAGGDRDLSARIACRRGDALRMEGEYDEAWRVAERADSLAREAEPTVLADCLVWRSILASETGRDEESMSGLRTAIEIEEKLGRTRSSLYAGILDQLGNTLVSLGRPREALTWFHREMAALDSAGRGGTVVRGIAQHNGALALDRLGETASAEHELHDVVTRVSLGDRTGWIEYQPLIHYAEAALTQDHADTAAYYFTRTVAQADSTGNRYWLGRGLFGLARAQARLGQLSAAAATLARFEKVADGFPRLTATDDQIPDARTIRGLIALARGDSATAAVELHAVLQAWGWFQGERLRRLQPVAALAAEAEVATGDPRSALELAKTAREVAAVDSLAELGSSRVGLARLVEARARLALVDSAGARSAGEAALRALSAGAGDDHPATRRARELVEALRRD